MLENLPGAIGRALSGIRPGLEKTTIHDPRLAALPDAITLTSLGFLDGTPMPARFTADGPGVSPPLEWRGVPAGTAEVIILIEDADSPTPSPLVHAIVHRLPGRDFGIAEGMISSSPTTLALGRNSYLKTGWLPADPPKGHGVHRYVFQVFALGSAAGLADHPGRGAVVEALVKHATARGTLIGTYQRV
jgi:Raf kinase inhibitor-like YbhB/YbcL family protein